jgi:hypothetical protein
MSLFEDRYQQLARQELLLFNNPENKSKVFYSRQLEIMFEDKYYHWITNRALRDLVESKEIISQHYNLKNAGSLNIVWHKSFRYYKRAAEKVCELVDSYSSPSLSAGIGRNGEFLVLEGFVANGFLFRGKGINEFNEEKWKDSEHNLDFIFSKDNVDYGVEVKNMLGYMDHDELEIKVRMYKQLNLKPIFAVRMFPKTWINEVNKSGGFSLIMKYQFYPIAHMELAEKVSQILGFPIKTPTSLQQGTMDRVLKWHNKHVNSK